MKCNETLSKWCKNKHGASKIIDTFETYQALSTTPILALPYFTIPFTLETYSCNIGIGVVFSEKGHPVAFVSRAFGPCNKGLSVYKNEYFGYPLGCATMEALEHLQPLKAPRPKSGAI
jgi:hypothetical protein